MAKIRGSSPIGRNQKGWSLCVAHHPQVVLEAVLLTAEAEPDQIDSTGDTEQESDQGQVWLIEETSGEIPDATPEGQARYEVAED
jgi:hypothetical protein